MNTNRERKNKYRNIKATLDGHTFDSMAEMHRYAELKMLEKAGYISDVKLQVPFVLQEGFRDRFGKRWQPIKYIADFVYFENGEMVIEDTKGFRTREYQLKKKMMAYRGYHIKEI